MSTQYLSEPPFLILAPMDGVVDWSMRDILTRIGGMDLCVTEFLRITKTVYPKKIFYEICPELLTSSKTRSGTPVFVQLLGSDCEMMAENAARAYELGALGIDINFGCPAKTVNRNEGGAVLLKTPERLFKIVSAVRKAVPSDVPVTAKMRLGFESTDLCLENATALEAGGAKWLTVHCRTKTDGYRPPAYWDWIPQIRDVVKIPVVANGEIWSVEDFIKCRQQTQANSFMIGRGVLADPRLMLNIRSLKSEWMKNGGMENNLMKKALPVRPAIPVMPLPVSVPAAGELESINQLSEVEGLAAAKKFDFEEHLSWVKEFHSSASAHVNPQFAMSRTKQWLKNLSLKHPEFNCAFNHLKIILDPIKFDSDLNNLIISPCGIFVEPS